MSKCTVVLAAAAVVGLASAGEFSDDRQMLAQAAASRPGSSPTASPPSGPQQAEDELTRLELEARAEATVALARLELVLSRKALRDARHEEAAQKARGVLALLKQLPPDMDVSVYELQAEGILAKAAREGVNVRALRRDAADRYGYHPEKEIVDTGAQIVSESERLYYQAALEGAYQDSEVRALVEAHEARVIPDGVISYPDDWPEKMKKREQYRGGMIARGPSWHDQDGREWYVAVYDIHDLIYVPPDFTGIQFNPVFAQRDALDRAALRYQSQIFRGWPQDLAAGIPLLRYFGGVDDWAYRGPKYSLERQRRIVELIQAFTETPQGEASIVPLPP